MPTPEIPIDQQIQERPTEIFSETLNKAGVTTTPSNPQSVKDDKGNNLISTPATSNAKIQIPSDRSTLVKKAKGKIEDSATWLARFFLRLISKDANTNTTD